MEVVKNWNKPIGVLFIDGDHTKAGEDFEAWEKFVVPGGIILFHDYITDQDVSVVKDCDRLVIPNKNYLVLYMPKLPEDKRLRRKINETSILQIKKL